MNAKIRNDVSVLSGGTNDSVTIVKRIPINKRNMKSPAMSPPRKYPIKNQYINRFITEQDPSLLPIKSKYPPGFKPLFNDAHDPKST